MSYHLRIVGNLSSWWLFTVVQVFVYLCKILLLKLLVLYGKKTFTKESWSDWKVKMGMTDVLYMVSGTLTSQRPGWPQEIGIKDQVGPHVGSWFLGRLSGRSDEDEGWWAAFAGVETNLRPTIYHLGPPDLPWHGCISDRGPAAIGEQTVLANERNGGRLRLIATHHDWLIDYQVGQFGSATWQFKSGREKCAHGQLFVYSCWCIFWLNDGMLFQIPNCVGSSLIRAFSQHVLHRLSIPDDGPLVS